MSTFATRSEAEGAIGHLRTVLERLPVAGSPELARVLGGAEALAGLLRSTDLVDPGQAAGTIRHREIHGLEPLEVTR